MATPRFATHHVFQIGCVWWIARGHKVGKLLFGTIMRRSVGAIVTYLNSRNINKQGFFRSENLHEVYSVKTKVGFKMKWDNMGIGNGGEVHKRGNRRLRRMDNERILHPIICTRHNNNSEKIKIVFRGQVQIFAQIVFLIVLKIVTNKTNSIATTRETT
jgi:hypothetical protein